MAQGGQGFAALPDDLSLIPGIHVKVERENSLHKGPL